MISLVPDDAPVTRRRSQIAPAVAKARVDSRNRSEKWFRFLGVAALSSAAAFLVILLTDIIVRAVPAFTQNSLAIEVPLKAELIDPAKPAAGDYEAAVRDALRGMFPTAQSRPEKKALESVLSVGAANTIRSAVMAEPGLIGKTLEFPVLLSADSDLYLKGGMTRVETSLGASPVTVSATTGPVTVTAGSGEFQNDLRLVKLGIDTLISDGQRNLRRLELSVKSSKADLTLAEQALAAAKQGATPETVKPAEDLVATLRGDVENLTKTVETANAQIKVLQDRASKAGSEEILDSGMPSLLLLVNGGVIKATRISPDKIEGEVYLPLTSTEPSSAWTKVLLETPEGGRKVNDRQAGYLEMLKAKGIVQSNFNFPFFAQGDSREPEIAGILGALTGTALTMLITLLLCLPIGVGAAVYLEEFAAKNKVTDIVEVSINNLAAVPSIVFGLLGLAVFLNLFGLPRSSAVVGGLVLALLVLPTIIIASRAALKAVPPSIREAALGVGASKHQAIFHHVLPLAMPGILTGTIIGMAHALGETAPLLMIGMVAFIADVPASFSDPATVLPVQIFLWSDLPELGFKAKTAAAILVLLVFLVMMNGLAIWLRRKFERRW